MPRRNKLSIYIFCLILYGSAAFADSIYLKDGEELRGIVVEEYTDRLVVSTYEGEKTLPKENIKSVLYDLIEQNLVKLGDKYMSKREYEKAYFYYEKACKANPDYKVARDKINYVTGYLFRQDKMRKLEDIKRKETFENWPPPASEKEKDLEKKLEDTIGARIAYEKNGIKIKGVIKNSPADRAGLEEDDTLISVWGRFTGYMSKEDVMRLLLEESAGEIKISIDRNIVLKENLTSSKSYEDIISGKLDMLRDGLTVVGTEDGASLDKNDLIVAINGVSTRYMPLREAIRMIEGTNRTLIFAARRSLTIWRR